MKRKRRNNQRKGNLRSIIEIIIIKAYKKIEDIHKLEPANYGKYGKRQPYNILNFVLFSRVPFSIAS